MMNGVLENPAFDSIEEAHLKIKLVVHNKLNITRPSKDMEEMERWKREEAEGNQSVTAGQSVPACVFKMEAE